MLRDLSVCRSGRIVRDALQHHAVHVLQHERGVHVLAPHVDQLLAQHGEGGAHDAGGRLPGGPALHLTVCEQQIEVMTVLLYTRCTVAS